MKLKRVGLVVFVLVCLYGAGVYLYFSWEPLSKDDCPITLPNALPFVLEDEHDPAHRFTTINDASCLNETRVYEVVEVKTIDDIRNALKKAREKKLHVAIAGVRHSMGGQAFYNDAIILDMRKFNHIIALDEQAKTITVESGATWHDIQLYLHEKNLAVKAMQSTDIFTVGGSVSVNAHGMDHKVGSIGSTIRSFTIMMADGMIKRVTPQDEPELFKAVIGGYGLFGVILEVVLEVTDNVMYKRDTIFLDYHGFPAFFEQNADAYELLYAHLSTSPLSFMHGMMVYGYKKIAHAGSFPPLRKISLVKARRFLINLSKQRSYAQVFKWFAEKYIDPAIDRLQSNDIISRNAVMHDSVEYLENVLVNETDILHEYFIPRSRFVECIDAMRTLLQNSKIPVLNVSVRVVHQESNILNYAPEPMFAIVLYLNQRVTASALHAMEQLTRDLIDMVISLGGTFFLPYQLYFTKDQLAQAYPNVDEFFALKKLYDPALLFMNNFYAKYAPR